MKFQPGDIVQNTKYANLRIVGVVSEATENTFTVWELVTGRNGNFLSLENQSHISQEDSYWVKLRIETTTIAADLLESRGESWSSSVFTPGQVDDLIKNRVIGK